LNTALHSSPTRRSSDLTGSGRMFDRLRSIPAIVTRICGEEPRKVMVRVRILGVELQGGVQVVEGQVDVARAEAGLGPIVAQRGVVRFESDGFSGVGD